MKARSRADVKADYTVCDNRLRGGQSGGETLTSPLFSSTCPARKIEAAVAM